MTESVSLNVTDGFNITLFTNSPNPVGSIHLPETVKVNRSLQYLSSTRLLSSLFTESLNFQVTLLNCTHPNHATAPPVLRTDDLRWSDRFAESDSLNTTEGFESFHLPGTVEIKQSVHHSFSTRLLPSLFGKSLNFEVSLCSYSYQNHATGPVAVRTALVRVSDEFAESASFFQLEELTGTQPFSPVAENPNLQTTMANWIYAVIGVGALLLLAAVGVVFLVIRVRREAAKKPPSAAESTECPSSFTENFALHEHMFSNPLADAESDSVMEPEVDSLTE
jgi:hypothetical protein